MKRLSLVFLVSLIVGCNDVKERKIKWGENFIKGDITFSKNDTVLNGVIEYSDSLDNLVAREFFKDNLRHGKSVIYSNRHIIQQAEYLYGYLNGWKENYDSMGGEVKSFYFFDKQFGPRVNFRNNIPFYFRFTNFDQRILYECKFDSNNVVFESGTFINYVTSYVSENGFEKIKINLYVIEPPLRKVSYRIYDLDEKSGERKLIDEFTSAD
jgi:antitoxin component YwqK of YwqJK toxin-antitoxin module